MSEAPTGYVTLGYAQTALKWPYSSVWSEARRGSFGPIERQGRSIWVEQAKVDAFVRRQAADHATQAGYSPEIVDRLPAFHEALGQAHKLGVGIQAATMERNMIIATIRGDAAEQRQAGDLQAAEDFETAADQLEAAIYFWDAEANRWSFRVETEGGVLVPPEPRQAA